MEISIHKLHEKIIHFESNFLTAFPGTSSREVWWYREPLGRPQAGVLSGASFKSVLWVISEPPNLSWIQIYFLQTHLERYLRGWLIAFHSTFPRTAQHAPLVPGGYSRVYSCEIIPSIFSPEKGLKYIGLKKAVAEKIYFSIRILYQLLSWRKFLKNF